MAIEFSCPKCDHLLRTADDKAGLSAKCPACGESIWVPYDSESRPEAEEAPPEPIREDASAGDLDFDDVPDADEASSAAPIAHEPAGEDVSAAAPEPAPPRAAPQEDVNCPNCHAANDAAATVCRFCGSSLEGVVPQPKPGWTPPEFDVSEIMSSTWRLYTQYVGLLIGCVLLIALTAIVVVGIVMVPVIISIVALEDDAVFVLIPAGIVLFPLLMIFGCTLQIGQTNLFLRIARGETASIGDVFYGFGDGRRFILRAFVISLTVLAAMLVGALLCCAPAVIVSLVAWPALPMLLQKDLPAGEIISRTIDFIKLKFGPVIAAGAIAYGIQTLAGMVPYLGAILQLFAVPFAQLMLMFAYLRITEQLTAVDRVVDG